MTPGITTPKRVIETVIRRSIRVIRELSIHHDEKPGLDVSAAVT